MNPTKKSAAEMIASYHNISAEDIAKFVDVDTRILTSLNIRLKYRSVIKQ